MSCGCGGCITRGGICVPRGDDTTVIFSVYDSDDSQYDISGATEIVFIVAEGVVVGGNIGPGGAVLIEKRLSLDEIVIAGTLFQFTVAIDAADTTGFAISRNYYEVQVTTSSGLKKTVANGVFTSQNTMIKDIV